MSKKVYIVGSVLKKAHATSGAEVNLASIADGAIGVCVAFSNKAKALKYAGKTLEVIITEVVRRSDD